MHPEELLLEGQKELVSVNTIMEKTEEEFEFVRFQLQSAKGVGEIIDVEEGLVSERFNISEKCLPKDIDTTCHQHLRDIEIPEVEVKKVSVLIGKDVDYAHDVLEERKPGSCRSQLKGVRGPLGWVITGTVLGASEMSVHFTSYNKKLYEQVDKFWNLEFFGTHADDKGRLETSVSNMSAPHNLSREDIREVEMLQNTTRMSEGHYETGLLWRDENVELPNNRSEAVRRLSSLRRRFSRDAELEERYRTVMEEYVAKGYAPKLTPEEAAVTGPRTWYLPHSPVLNPNKSGKVRIVFDAAAEYGGTSLNSNLLQGPDCTNNLVAVLLRFRQDHTAIVADIESMFQQVKVREQDQDSLRFLWWDGGTDEHPKEYVMTVHIFAATDSPCTAISMLKRTADDNEHDFDPTTLETLRRNFYVDDVLRAVPTPEAAIKLSNQLTKLCARGGFNLTKFLSNDRRVLAEIPVEKRATPSLDLELDELPVNRVLGIRWNIEIDTFGFKVMDLSKPNTMREMLSTIASVFDPLNFAAPVMLLAKQIMQDLWHSRIP